MHSKNFLSLALASAALFGIATPTQAAVVFDFEAAAIGAFRNWTPPGDPHGGPFQNDESEDTSKDLPRGLTDPPGNSPIFESETETLTEQLPPDVAVAAVPEPASLALVGLGLAAVAVNRRRRARR